MFQIESVIPWRKRSFGQTSFSAGYVYLLVEGNDQHGLAEEISL